MNIYIKIKIKLWFNIKKGYKKFINDRGLENFRSLKKNLFLVNIKHNKLKEGLILQTDLNKPLLQYVNQKLFDNYFFYVFLFFFNKNKKIIFPIPKEFNSVLKNHNYDVNFFLSNTLWKFFCIFQMFIGLKELFILILSSVNTKKNKEIKKNYSIYPNMRFDKLNLANTKEENKKLFNVVRWCDDNFSETFSIFLTNKKVPLNNFYESFKDIGELFSYKMDKLRTFLWSLKVFFLSLYWLLTLNFWKLLILPEIVNVGYIKFSKQKSPKNIFFIWTNNHYRPLWTYEFNQEEKIKMIFVGSLNGLILKGESKLTSNDFEGLSIATWPNYYAWHIEHKKYILERINYPATVHNLDNQVFFKDKIKKLILPDNSISVFGYENNKIILGYATLADYDTQNKNLLQNFYEHIYEMLDKNNFFLILKRKKKLGNIEIKRFRKFFNNFKKKNKVIFVDEDYAAEKIIKATKATISMPFTSTAFIAKKMSKPSIFYDPCKWINLKDPSSLGMEVFNCKESLNKWIETL